MTRTPPVTWKPRGVGEALGLQAFSPLKTRNHPNIYDPNMGSLLRTSLGSGLID